MKIMAVKLNSHLLTLKTSITTCRLIASSAEMFKVRKGAKIKNRYNQVPHLTQDTKGKVTNSQLDTTNESQEISPFQAGDHKAHIQMHSNTRQKKT